MTIQRVQRRGMAAARAAASTAGKVRGGGPPSILSNKVWLVVVMTLLVAAMALQSLAVATPSWVRVGCHQGAVTVGLWMTCGQPLVNVTSPRRTPETSAQLNASSLKVESMKRSVSTMGTSEKEPEMGQNRKPASFLFWDDCVTVVSGVDHSYPVWFEATQLLESMGLGCTAITTLLLTLYACAPTFMALQVALGFAAASFTSGGFIIVGMFNISGGRRGVVTVLPPGVTCDGESSSLHVSFKLSSVAVSLLGVAGVVATLASILEKGDAPQNRNRKGEEAAAAAAEVAATDPAAITPPASPSPPSTISDNESTPLSFDSVYESDCPYPCEHKNALSSKKRVSFQNRRTIKGSGSSISQPVSLGNSISAGAPMCNIPVSHSAPYNLHQPLPRRLSSVSIDHSSVRRESSPLGGYYHYPQSHPHTMGRRQGSLPAGHMDYVGVGGSRRMSQEDKLFAQMTQSRNINAHHPRESQSHSRRSSRT